MSTHQYLKTLSPYYQAIDIGVKPFEVRFNDRDYQVGDILHLQEFIPPEMMTGREIIKEVTYVLSDPLFCKEGYVVLGIKDVPRQLTLDELRQMDGMPVWIHWIKRGARIDRWFIWEKPRPGTMFDLDDPAIRSGEIFIAYDRPPGGDRP